jgi:hypothetical protein
MGKLTMQRLSEYEAVQVGGASSGNDYGRLEMYAGTYLDPVNARTDLVSTLVVI